MRVQILSCSEVKVTRTCPFTQGVQPYTGGCYILLTSKIKNVDSESELKPNHVMQ